MSTLKNNFSLYLANRGVSKNTKKNYLSDFQHFSVWFLRSVQHLGVGANEFSQVISFVDHTSANNYKIYLLKRSTPVNTVNRKLSSLRLLSSFFLATSITSFDFMESVGNVQVKKPAQILVIEKYKKHLEQERVSDNTIKGYLSDIKQFLTWVESSKI